MRGQTKLELKPLRQAFAKLRRYGILAEMDYLCCGNCGSYAMEKEYKAAPEDDKPVGYCFFHGQDMDCLIEEGSAMLNFNGFDAVSSVFVGNLIVDTLSSCGVRCKWDGDVRHRIEFWVDRKKAKVKA